MSVEVSQVFKNGFEKNHERLYILTVLGILLILSLTLCSVPSVRNAIDHIKNAVDQSICQTRRTFESYLSI